MRHYSCHWFPGTQNVRPKFFLSVSSARCQHFTIFRSALASAIAVCIYQTVTSSCFGHSSDCQQSGCTIYNSGELMIVLDLIDRIPVFRLRSIWYSGHSQRRLYRTWDIEGTLINFTSWRQLLLEICCRLNYCLYCSYHAVDAEGQAFTILRISYSWYRCTVHCYFFIPAP